MKTSFLGSRSSLRPKPFPALLQDVRALLLLGMRGLS
jgi:hypothetical protein